MQDLISKYLINNFGDINIPENDEEKEKLVRALFGFSIVNRLDYWLDYARDYLENKEPDKPFPRDNEQSRKDKFLRDTFSKLDNEIKQVILELINSTATGIVFSMLVNFDQFDFGKIILSLKPKAVDKTEIKISSDSEDYMMNSQNGFILLANSKMTSSKRKKTNSALHFV